VVPLSDGGTVLAGYTRSVAGHASDMVLVKTEQRLVTLSGYPPALVDFLVWDKTYGGSLDDEAKALVQSSDGGFVVAGYTRSFGAGASDMYLVKTDSNGTLLWSTTFGGLNDDGANCLIQTSDGGYALAGYTSSYADSNSTWMVKTDASGNMQWSIVCPGQSGTSLVQTNDGGYALAVESSDAFELVKLAENGQLQWNQTFSGSSVDARAMAVVQTRDGGYAVAGWMLDETGNYSALLLKTDSLGALQWNRTYVGWGAYGLVQTSSGGYAMTGDNACLVVTDSSGNPIWEQDYAGAISSKVVYTKGYVLVQTTRYEYVIAVVQCVDGALHSGPESYMVRVTINV
jgi:hypothetical protein